MEDEKQKDISDLDTEIWGNMYALKKESDKFHEKESKNSYIFFAGYFAGMATLAGVLKANSIVYLCIGFLVVIWIAYYIEFNKGK